MGFNLEVAKGRSIAIKPVKSHGAPATINLTELLKTPGKDRAKWLKEHSDQTLGKEAAKQLKEAESLEQLLEALDKKIAKKVTPRTVPKGAIVLQPSDERRRSGSHYTPRSLTEPIVRTTLEPILKQLLVVSSELLEEEQRLLARNQKLKTFNRQLATDLERVQRRIELARAAAAKGVPHPRQILELKICDPAMGSGAFLVEACRQLAEELVKSWYAHCVKVISDKGVVISGEEVGRGDLDLETDDGDSDSEAFGITNGAREVKDSQNPSPLITNHYPLTTPFPAIPPDEDEVLYARRLVAQRCLYGVDKNEMAVDLAKLSLWLVTLAKEHPFTFLDHSLRHGDSLVGLTRKQIIGFHWEPKKQKQFGEELIQERLDRATKARAKILNAREDVPYRDQEQRLALADESLNVVRMTGDACVSAFFTGKKAKEREKLCEELFLDVARHFQALKEDKFDVEARSRIANAAASLRTGEHPISPFHWEIEFSEVFSRANGGFDAFVGNPPFLGGMRISAATSSSYKDYLYSSFDQCRNRADLVAYFFRQAFSLLRDHGALGLISTNTIAQGDTRIGGLGYICHHGGTIYSATSRLTWPGIAAVIVSVVHVLKGPLIGGKRLNGSVRNTITSFLFPAGGDENPAPLHSNKGLSYKGSVVLGMGFTFDDEGNQDVATPLSRMDELIRMNPANQQCISPYIGGEEVVNSITQSHRRYIINFGDRDLDEAADWPDLLAIIEEKVLPYRRTQKRKVYRDKWWQYAEKQAVLYERARAMPRVLVIPEVCPHLAVAFLPTNIVFASTLYVILLDSYGAFCSLQSRPHECWTRFLSSSMKDDLRYVPSDCLETFPFPCVDDDNQVTLSGQEYYEFRARLLVRDGLGLTKTYNRFHDPHEKSPEILKLRELHEAMDRAVLEAYGWHDLAQTARCEFLLDYEEDGVEGGEWSGERKTPVTLHTSPSTSRRKRLPWRLRWPDDFRDEVLARLLELNEQRHKEELLGVSSELLEKKKTAKKTDPDTDAAPKKKRATKKKSSDQTEMF